MCDYLTGSYNLTLYASNYVGVCSHVTLFIDEEVMTGGPSNLTLITVFESQYVHKYS